MRAYTSKKSPNDYMIIAEDRFMVITATKNLHAMFQELTASFKKPLDGLFLGKRLEEGCMHII